VEIKMAEPEAKAPVAPVVNEPAPTATEPVKPQEKLFTQADLDKIVADRLARKEESDRKKAEENSKKTEEAKLKEQNEWKTIAEKKDAELLDIQRKLKDREVLDLKRTTAAKFGIPESLAIRLVGSTPEELEADAKQLAETLPKAKEVKPSPGITNPGDGAVITQTPEQRGKDLLYSGNMNWARGGGVIMPD
jgi:hypothetical protein